MIIAGTTAGTITVVMKRENSTTGTVGGIEGGCRLVLSMGQAKSKEWNGQLIPSMDEA